MKVECILNTRPFKPWHIIIETQDEHLAFHELVKYVAEHHWTPENIQKFAKELYQKVLWDSEKT